MLPAIGVLGTGRMGSALARALVSHGYETVVWNRTTAKCAPLAALGAQVADSVAALASATSLVIVNVDSYRSADALLASPDVASALRGKSLVQLTSGSPKAARVAAAWAEGAEIGYLDGAIMATPNFIGGGAATILYSGPRDLFEQCRPVLAAFGGNTRHIGSDPGLASAMDVALLGQMWGAMFGTLLGITVCEAEGIALDDYVVHRNTFGPVVEGANLDLIARARAGRFAADESTLASISAHYGAFRHLLDLFDDRGLDRIVPDAFDHVFQRAIGAGHLHDDFAALVPFVRRAETAVEVAP